MQVLDPYPIDTFIKANTLKEDGTVEPLQTIDFNVDIPTSFKEGQYYMQILIKGNYNDVNNA